MRFRYIRCGALSIDNMIILVIVVCTVFKKSANIFIFKYKVLVFKIIDLTNLFPYKFTRTCNGLLWVHLF